MEGIDKARLLSGLLRENGRYKMADSQTRPFIAYEIKLLRKRLGMSTGLPEDVLERVKNNPADMSKTLRNTRSKSKRGCLTALCH